MSDHNSEFVNLVKEIKAAIQNAQLGTGASGLAVKKVDLELNTVIEKTGGINIVKILSFDISAEYKKEEINIIKMSLVPEPSSVKLMGSVQQELEESIRLVNTVLQEAALSAPVFELNEASIELKFGVNKSGKVEVIASGSGKSALTHTIRLTLGNI